MEVILTGMCAGKTTLERKLTNYVDMDFFCGVKSRRQIAIAKRMIELYSKEAVEGNYYIFNIDRFEKLELYTIPTIKIKEIVIPIDFEFRKEIFMNRQDKGDSSFEYFLTHLENNVKLARLYSHKYKVPLHFLKGGEFLYDYFYNQSV